MRNRSRVIGARCGKGYVRSVLRRNEGNALFNDTLKTFYLQLYGVEHMVKDRSDRDIGNVLPPHELLFPIGSQNTFIWNLTQTE